MNRDGWYISTLSASSTSIIVLLLLDDYSLMDGFLNYLSDTEDEPTNHLLINLRQFSFLFFFKQSLSHNKKAKKGERIQPSLVPLWLGTELRFLFTFICKDTTLDKYNLYVFSLGWILRLCGRTIQFHPSSEASSVRKWQLELGEADGRAGSTPKTFWLFLVRSVQVRFYGSTVLRLAIIPSFSFLINLLIEVLV